MLCHLVLRCIVDSVKYIGSNVVISKTFLVEQVHGRKKSKVLDSKLTFNVIFITIFAVHIILSHIETSEIINIRHHFYFVSNVVFALQSIGHGKIK